MGDPLRVGLFGRLGSGNTGNDGTLEAMLAFLRREYPSARLAALCTGPSVVSERYRIPARQLHHVAEWRRPTIWKPLAWMVGALFVAIGLFMDTVGTAAWVSRQDVVIVPGMGTLEGDLAERPWEMPWSLFVLVLAGRMFGTKVALAGIGVSFVPGRLNRFLLMRTARSADYCSVRDAYSASELRRMGKRTETPVCVDLAFSLPGASEQPPQPGLVGVGVMDYGGRSRNHTRVDTTRAGYISTMAAFVRWLLDEGHRVRLLAGDADDDHIASEIISLVRCDHPGLARSDLQFEPVRTLGDVITQVSTVDVAVVTRYHNVVAALRASTPVVAIGYGKKHASLMESAELSGMTVDITELEHGLLVEHFVAMWRDRARIRTHLADRQDAREALIRGQLAALSRSLLGPVATEPEGAR